MKVVFWIQHFTALHCLILSVARGTGNRLRFSYKSRTKPYGIILSHFNAKNDVIIILSCSFHSDINLVVWHDQVVFFWRPYSLVFSCRKIDRLLRSTAKLSRTDWELRAATRSKLCLVTLSIKTENCCWEITEKTRFIWLHVLFLDKKKS